MVVGDSAQPQDLAVWRALQDWLGQDEEGQAILDRLKTDPQVGAGALAQWIQTRSVQAPPRLATYIAGGHVEKLINIAQARVVLIQQTLPPTPPSALYPLPPDIADFTGRREELTRVIAILEQAAETRGTAVVISAVAGMAGVGKSALAIHVAHRLKDRFPDAHLYVDLRGAQGQPLAPVDVLGRLLRALGVENQFIPESLNERASLYRSRMTDKQALVLLDNAHDEAQVRPLLPGNPSCAVLVTSRKRLSALEGAALIDLKVMDEDEALELLGLLAGAERVQVEPEAARRIVTLCGQLPLAIRIAGGKLRGKPHWDLETYASQLDSERRRLGRLHLGDLDVRASFALSYRDLTADDVRLFRLLVLAGHSFSPEVAALLLETDLDTAWEALERLVDLQLLEPTGGERYRFHDLMRLFAQEQLEQEEPAEEQQAARSRADRWYLTASEVHFYAQAEILDRYTHSPNPAADPEMLEAVLTTLETREDLRRYFFRSGPSTAWAPILWERSFFDNPPPRQKTDEGYVVPQWDVLYYLNSVAAEVPDVIVKVAESIEGEGRHISLAMRALCHIPAERAVKLVPRVVQWLCEPRIAVSIASETIGLIVHLAQGKQFDAALNLTHALTAPIPSSDLRTVGGMVWGAEARSKFLSMHDYETGQFFDHHIPQLAALAPERVVATLQEHLCTALRLEAEALGEPDFETRSWWRTAIEDTGQDLDNTYRDRLLRALRDALEAWVQADALAAEPLIRQYLRDEREILQRLGLHILRRFPAKYKALVVEELRRFENLDDTGIYHEFFMLLRAGFPLLDVPDQEALVAAICDGPPPERVKRLVEWAKENKGIVDVEEYSRRHVMNWIRDRLWMLQSYVSGKPADTLQELNEELGPPQIPPGFLRWSSGGFAVREIAPISEQELAKMPPEELVRYIQERQPDPQQSFGPEQVSYEGLASAVAKVILKNPQNYEEQLASIALYRPEFAYALLGHTRDEKPATSEAWELGIGLCETLLADETVRADMTRTFGVSWIGVRLAIVRLMQLGLKNEQYRIPSHLLPRARDVLLVLLNDPDPDAKADRPPEEYLEHEDPATVVIQAVRPSALSALIEYAGIRARLADEEAQGPTPEGPGPKRLEPVVQEALTRKLDRHEDPSWAVHSVYGQYLTYLYWLDQEWVESHVDQILPEGKDDDSVRYYIAAWDSYVGSRDRLYTPIIELLRPKYKRAIYNLGKGWVTRTHFGPGRHLASHVALEYLRSDYELSLPAGPQNLIALFYREAPVEVRGGVPWTFWRVLEGSVPANRETYWPKVRVVWEWRARQASTANHSTDFDDEMQWFAHMLPVLPGSETIASLWPLLEALLPHITRSEQRTTAWDAVEKYLAAEVDRDSVGAIRFYHLMHEQRPQPEWYRASDEAWKIIETAAADRNACRDALSLIGLLAQRGNYEFQDVYERHKGRLTGGRL